MSETVDRVARAIFDATPAELGRVAFDNASELARRIAVEQALAALAVIRETGLPDQDEHEVEIAQVVSRIRAALPAGRAEPPPRRDGRRAVTAGLLALATAAAALVALYWRGPV